MRRMKDRDFLRTLEGFLFCVVGYSHPPDRVVSYLKYTPGREGKWGKGEERYARTMPNYTTPSLLSNIEWLRRNHPQYVFHSRIFNIQMSAVPHGHIAECYFPSDKLQTLFKSQHLDSLQEATVDLVSCLTRQTGISPDDFGVTGSLLTDIHNPGFSDIDLTVYGRTNAWKVKDALTADPSLSERSWQQKRKTLERWATNYYLTLDEAEQIYDRRWNYGRLNDRRFSIHAVRRDEEITEKYGDARFFPRGIVEGRAEIAEVEESLFLPCTYQVNRFVIVRGNDVGPVCEIVSYDGLFAGLFDRGEHVSIRGKLEEVVDRAGNQHLRILVGSPEAQGRDYIKPIH